MKDPAIQLLQPDFGEGRGRVVGGGREKEKFPNLSPVTRDIYAPQDKTATLSPGELNLPWLAWELKQSWVLGSCRFVLFSAWGLTGFLAAPSWAWSSLLWKKTCPSLMMSSQSKMGSTLALFCKAWRMSFSRHWTCLTSQCRMQARLIHQSTCWNSTTDLQQTAPPCHLPTSLEVSRMKVNLYLNWWNLSVIFVCFYQKGNK